MKKFLTLCTALALCLALAGSGTAFEGQSLENRTSFGLFDEIDPYDLTLDPSLLYEVDRWRLYTNLSNYEDADAYYLLGTSGKLGRGSVALFYETNKGSVDEGDLVEDDWLGTETVWVAPYFSGLDDTIVTSQDERWFEDEYETHNFLASYSMDFGMFSLGLAYEPSFYERTVDLQLPDFNTNFIGNNGAAGHVSLGGTATNFNFWTSTTAWDGTTINNLGDTPFSRVLAEGGQACYGCVDGPITLYDDAGSGNFRRSSQTVTYADASHTQYSTETESDSFTGDNDVENDTHGITVGSHVRPSDEWDFQVHIGYENVDMEVDGDATYAYAYSLTNTAGSADTRTLTSRWDGEFIGDICDDAFSHDGDVWTFRVEPEFILNETVMLDLGLQYRTGDGDADGDYTQSITIARSNQVAGVAAVPTWNGTILYDNTWDGDWDSESWAVEPKVVLTYGPVDFSLGVGYEYEEDELDGRTRQDMAATWAYNNGDAVPLDTLDWTFSGSSTSYMDWDREVTTETWRFPVAARVKVGEKWTWRAGAEFGRWTRESEWSSVYYAPEDNLWTVTNGAGSVTAAGESYYTVTGLLPYDPTTEIERRGESKDITEDYTLYRLGVGYQFTENLSADLMFEAVTGDHPDRTDADETDGGVDLSTVFASVVLAF